MHILKLLLFAAAASAVLSSPPSLRAEGFRLFVEFFDAGGKLIEAPVEVRSYRGAAVGLSFLLEWVGELDPVSGRLTRAPHASRLEITVPVGPQTPRLAALQAKGATLQRVVFHFAVQSAAGGPLADFYVVTVENVNIVKHALRLPDRLDRELALRDDEETLGLVYTAMEQGGFRVEQRHYLPGDTNGDLRVDISDPILLLGYLFLGSIVRCPLSGDINSDAKLDISDAVAELSFLFSGGRPPPAPFPRCGVRPENIPIACDASACDG